VTSSCNRRQRGRLGFSALAFLLLLAAGSGCATPGGKSGGATRRALRAVPEVPAGLHRADHAILRAFFAANGIDLSQEKAEAIIPYTAPRGRMDRHLLREAARDNGRVLLVVKADRRYLWEELGNDIPVLILLPASTNYTAAPTPYVPIAWDKGARTLELLDGNAEILEIDEDEFFARRAPLKHAALCLMRPGAVRRMVPSREQKLLLADFWYHQGAYRRAEATYNAIQTESPEIVDLAALLGKAAILVGKGKYADAIPLYRQALAMEPDNSKILNNLAYCMLHGGGDLLPALRHSAKAAKLDPDNPLVLETLGSINLRLGDGPQAARYLELAWARAMKSPVAVQIAIMDQLARAWLACHREDLAWQVASHRHRTFPQYRFPRDLILYFPALRKPPEAIPGSLPNSP
jgi:tetratricopeptide (TPR) repeat protein